MRTTKVTPDSVRASKGKQTLAVLTAYDYPMAKLLDESGIDLILVGDSLGMVVLGYPDTTLVTMEEMLHHVRAVARAKPQALIVADLPYQSYQTANQAVANARRLREAGADAVKAEGGHPIADQVRAIRAEGIPFMGHIGMLPQHVRLEGGYHIKGRSDEETHRLTEDADTLCRLGAFAIVVELVHPPAAKQLTTHIPVPTIGIGSGPHCDGQVLVLHDLLGLFPWFKPKFVTPKLNGAEQIRATVQEWKNSL